MQHYKSLCAGAMICATLVNTQTHSFSPVILLAQPTALESDEENKHEKVSKSIKTVLFNAVIMFK